MGWWSRLFGPHGPEPAHRVDDPVFVPLMWSEDDDSWVGEYGGHRIAIGYSGSAEPAPELLARARAFLGPHGATFARTLGDERAARAHEFGRRAAEFRGLRIGTLGFGMSGRGMGCQVELIGGEPDRSWRAEFDGAKYLGFGFDT